VAVVVGSARAETRGATGDVEIWVRGDPGVEHRDIDIDPLVETVELGDRVPVRIDAVDAGRDRLRGLLNGRWSDTYARRPAGDAADAADSSAVFGLCQQVGHRAARYTASAVSGARRCRSGQVLEPMPC
jgi:hypothetical protein